MTEMLDQDAESGTRFRRVAVHSIHAFDRNPRRVRNPEYDRIKHSIRARGLEQPLVITARPGESTYVVHAGGNTRLAVLKELFGETGDARFSAVDCVVTPWEADAATVLAHLRENEMRGALSFIDRARAIVDWQRLVEVETGKKLSQRQLAARLSADGYSISQPLISHMVYAVDVLLPVLPQAFGAGLGRRQVERVRTLERAGRAVWRNYHLGSQSAFLTVFLALCERSDDADWTFEGLRSALEVELAGGAEVGLHAVRVAIEQALGSSCALLTNDESSIARTGSADPFEREASADDDAEVDDAEGDEAKAPAPLVIKGTREEDQLVGSDPSEGLGRAGQDAATNVPAGPSCSICVEQGGDHPVAALDPAAIDDVGQLRAQAYQLAESLAQRYGLGTLIKPLVDRAAGYLLIDVPDASLTQTLDEEQLGEIALLWWHLAACAELTVAPPEAVTPLMPETSTLRRILETRDAELLYQCVPMLDPAQMGDLLWRRLTEHDWQDLIQLISTYRRLRALARASAGSLWN